MERTRGCHISTHLGCFTPHSSPSHDMGEDNENKQDQLSSSMNMDWKSATCAVCMEPPHNAILLLCASHERGCRPYMCNTSYQHSNCLELFKKAYTVSVSTNQKTLPQHSSAICNKSKVLELPCPQCPLCRGQVKGWTVIGPARKYLDNKRRSCMQGECSFIGTFLELQQHIRENHPFPKPLEVDPELEKRWREIELERERQDVISFISSSMPNSVILGDYVIDRELQMFPEYIVTGGGGGNGGYRGDGCMALGLFWQDGTGCINSSAFCYFRTLCYVELQSSANRKIILCGHRTRSEDQSEYATLLFYLVPVLDTLYTNAMLLNFLFILTNIQTPNNSIFKTNLKEP